MRFVTQNGLYDWGWLRTEADIRMPPSEHMEEIGALATMIDENRYTYNLDDLCAWRGLPGKDEVAADRGGQPTGLRRSDEKRSTFKRTSGNCQRAMSDRTPKPTLLDTLALFENLNPDPRSRRHA